MNGKLFKLLLLASLLISVFDRQYTVNANTVALQPSEEYGYFVFDQPTISIATYARSKHSKTLFAVAITSPRQVKDGNGLVVPTALLADCKKGTGRFNLMESLPTKNKKKITLEIMQGELMKFCSFHKQYFKHAHW